MKLVYATIILLLLFPSLAWADGIEQTQQNRTDANVIGHVEDAKTREHLPYINITVKGTNIGVTTDATGHYMLKNLPVGDIILEASLIGYKKVEKQISLQANTLLEVNFLMEEENLTLDEVVVSATRNETNKREAPIIVNVMSTKLFESTASCSLTEAMNFQPGLRVETNCGNCGNLQLRINGLEGQYSQILLDSRPIFSSLAGVYGLEQLPVGMIERVEVVRGGGSALFGASAIGGVVNIITKEPLRNSVTVTNTTNILENGRTDVNTALNGSFVSDDHKAGIYVFGVLKNREYYDHNDDGFSDVPEINSETVGFRGYYRTSHNSRLTAEYHHIHEFRRGGNAFGHPPHEADIAEQLNHKIDGGGLHFNTFTSDYKHRLNLFTSAQIIRRESYFGVDKNLDAYGNTNDETLVAGAQYTLAMDNLLFMPAELTAGFEYNYNGLHDSFVGLGREMEQETHIVGGYLQNEWKTNQFSFLVGARLDKHNLMEDAVFSPRVNFRYSPSDMIGLRASYSSGYRAPQTYNEDLHIEAVGGSLSMIELADNLNPEYSHSISASVDLYHNFGTIQTNLLVEGFYTMLDDVFTLEKIAENEDENVIHWERRNGAGAKIKGINIEGKLGIPNVFEIQLGYTFQSNRYNEPEEWSDQLEAQRKMFRTPNNYGYMTANYNITQAFKASLFANYTGSMLVKHTLYDGVTEIDKEQTTPDFWDMGVKFAYNFKLGTATNLELNAGVKNIFNAYQKDLDYGALKDSSYVYGPALPRMYFFGVKLAI